ncbi:MAG: zf-HC2 domain-containing protein [Kiritimatiellales bacterium]|nr:zf-HC2 domain-containing protein [Kiritimatiellales bacterium]
MLSCKDVSKLVSDSLDVRLSVRQRVGVRVHLAMCGMCRAYRRQMVLLRRLLPGYARWLEEDGSSVGGLSPDAAGRIKNKLVECAKNPVKKNPPSEV